VIFVPKQDIISWFNIYLLLTLLLFGTVFSLYIRIYIIILYIRIIGVPQRVFNNEMVPSPY
jgi:hypothetical protein